MVLYNYSTDVYLSFPNALYIDNTGYHFNNTVSMIVLLKVWLIYTAIYFPLHQYHFNGHV